MKYKVTISYVSVNLEFTVVLSLVVKSIKSNCECSENEITALTYLVNIH